MLLTLEELCERLRERVDPDLLVEELELTTEQLVDRFEDVIEMKYGKLLPLVED